MSLDRATLAAPAAVALAVLLPARMPKRRLLTFGALAGARAWADESRLKEGFTGLSFGAVPGLTKEENHLVNRASSAASITLLVWPAIALGRALPISRFVAAPALAGGYWLPDDYLNQQIQGVVAKARAEKQATGATGDEPHAVEDVSRPDAAVDAVVKQTPAQA